MTQFAVLLTALLLAPLSFADDALKGYDGYVLKPDTGKMRVTVVLLSPKEDNKALLYFQGTGSPWDDKVILHRISNGGKSFRADYAGAEKEILHVDQYGAFSLYPPKYYGDGISVSQDKKETKNLDLNSVISRYKENP